MQQLQTSRVIWSANQRRFDMAIQTVSDELYRRHEREWAAMRDALESTDNGQSEVDQGSGQTSFDHKPTE